MIWMVLWMDSWMDRLVDWTTLGYKLTPHMNTLENLQKPKKIEDN